MGASSPSPICRVPYKAFFETPAMSLFPMICNAGISRVCHRIFLIKKRQRLLPYVKPLGASFTKFGLALGSTSWG